MMKTLWFSLSLTAASLAHTTTQLTVEHRVNPVGLDDAKPRFAWNLAPESPEEAQGLAQSAYHIVAYSDDSIFWDSGKVASTDTAIVFPEASVPSGSLITWQVRTWDQNDQASEWSDKQTFTTAVINGEPTAPWISFKDDSTLHRERTQLYLPPARYYRTTFKPKQKITRAVAYASALGIYELEINGQKVSDTLFAPGWTNYRKRAYYNTYDVTHHFQSGKNALGAVVADGWYAGYVGYGKFVGYGPSGTGRNIYGKTPALMVEVHLTYEDGSTEKVSTSPDWKVSTGPELEADFLMGETYDARKELTGWSTASYDDSAWQSAILAKDNGSVKAEFKDAFKKEKQEFGFVKPPVLQAYPAQPVRVTQEIASQSVTEQAPGVYIFNLGQNIAGNIRLKVKGEAGQKIVLRFGEMLHPDGRLMTENLRQARATDTYILKGDPAGETWSPRFTFHGFQFVEVRGLSEKPALETITGLVIHSDTPLTSGFECSDPVVNKVFQNAVWTQRGNWIDIPTDCPQRDERMGWTGDAQIYASTAAYHADVAAFFKKWLRELEDSMTPEGYYPSYAPYPFGHGGAIHGTAWSDAGIIVPHAIWEATGDTDFFTKHWAAMTRFMEARKKHDPELKGTAFGAPWGDWLNLDDATPHPYIDLCYFHLISEQMEAMAAAQKFEADVAKYRSWAETLRRNFRESYLNEDGTLKITSQSAHVLALDCGMVREAAARQKIGAALANLIAKSANEKTTGMTTGFLGTKPLLPVLTATGHHDAAIKLIQSQLYPSWGYEVKNGATTIWERWNSYTEEYGFGGPNGKLNASMNSFSHYSFGAVTGWMMSTLAGIAPAEPGYTKITLHPHFPSPEAYEEDPKTISYVKAHHDSPQGRIAIHWKKNDDGSLLYEATVPSNTTATLILPKSSPFKSANVPSETKTLAPGQHSFLVK